MASIEVIVGGIVIDPEDTDQTMADCNVHVQGTTEYYGFTVVFPANALAATKNQEIKDAAVFVAQEEGHTVGISDKKTAWGGAVGL